MPELPAGVYKAFPGLAGTPHRRTSSRTARYNCIGWAAGDKFRFWWPKPKVMGYYWPEGVPREETLAAFEAAYATIGYAPCEGGDVEPGYEKVAIYAYEGMPKHAARQLPTGRWTSKLGPSEDIEHELGALEGFTYGYVVRFMRRRLPA